MGFLAVVTVILSVAFWAAVIVSFAQGFDPVKILMIIGIFFALVCTFVALFVVSDIKTKHSYLDPDADDSDGSDNPGNQDKITLFHPDEDKENQVNCLSGEEPH